jgi:hypothetical protein
MRRGDAFVRFMAWVYTAGFAFVVIVTHVSYFNDAQGRSFGLFQIDARDDVVHIMSAIAGIVVASTGRWMIPYFWAVTSLYGIDAIVGLLTRQGFLDLSVFTAPWQSPDFGMTNIAVNLPHIVIVAVAIAVLVRAWRSDASVASPASI